MIDGWRERKGESESQWPKAFVTVVLKFGGRKNEQKSFGLASKLITIQEPLTTQKLNNE
jgi:hypothetical protein